MGMGGPTDNVSDFSQSIQNMPSTVEAHKTAPEDGGVRGRTDSMRSKMNGDGLKSSTESLNTDHDVSAELSSAAGETAERVEVLPKPDFGPPPAPPTNESAEDPSFNDEPLTDDEFYAAFDSGEGGEAPDSTKSAEHAESDRADKAPKRGVRFNVPEETKPSKASKQGGGEEASEVDTDAEVKSISKLKEKKEKLESHEVINKFKGIEKTLSQKTEEIESGFFELIDKYFEDTNDGEILNTDDIGSMLKEASDLIKENDQLQADLDESMAEVDKSTEDVKMQKNAAVKDNSSEAETLKEVVRFMPKIKSNFEKKQNVSRQNVNDLNAYTLKGIDQFIKKREGNLSKADQKLIRKHLQGAKKQIGSEKATVEEAIKEIIGNREKGLKKLGLKQEKIDKKLREPLDSKGGRVLTKRKSELDSANKEIESLLNKSSPSASKLSENAKKFTGIIKTSLQKKYEGAKPALDKGQKLASRVKGSTSQTAKEIGPKITKTVRNIFQRSSNKMSNDDYAKFREKIEQFLKMKDAGQASEKTLDLTTSEKSTTQEPILRVDSNNKLDIDENSMISLYNEIDKNKSKLTDEQKSDLADSLINFTNKYNNDFVKIKENRAADQTDLASDALVKTNMGTYLTAANGDFRDVFARIIAFDLGTSDYVAAAKKCGIENLEQS
jgi:hypothetical protein